MVLISGKEISNMEKLDFKTYENAFVENNKTIYSYSAIQCIKLTTPSILEVL